MGVALPDGKRRQQAVITAVTIVVAPLPGSLFPRFLVDGAPTRGCHHLARSLESDPSGIGKHRGLHELAVGVEGGYEAAGDQMVELTLVAHQGRGRLPGRDDGMVVGDLGVVKHLLALGYPGKGQHRRGQGRVRGHGFQNPADGRVNVI